MPSTTSSTFDMGELVVCMSCFRLRGFYRDKEHRCSCQPHSAEWRDTVWARYDLAQLVDLCHLCARQIVGSGSRWSWYGCGSCREVNLAVATAVGSPPPGILPLGRHSLMNGAGMRGDVARDDEQLTAFVDALMSSVRSWTKLSAWQATEAADLATRAGWLGNGTTEIPLSSWLIQWPGSPGASVDAFCRFLETDLPPTTELAALLEARSIFRATNSQALTDEECGPTPTG